MLCLTTQITAATARVAIQQCYEHTNAHRCQRRHAKGREEKRMEESSGRDEIDG